MKLFLIIFLVPIVSCNLPRLTKKVTPIEYFLTLKTYLPGYGIRRGFEGTFEGNVIINLKLDEATDSITLHASENINFDLERCTISSQTVDQSNTNLVKNITKSDEYQQVQIAFHKAIPAGIVTLNLTYASDFDDGNMGLYLSPYNDTQGNTKYAAVTQFEAYSARSAVPCFDEPDFKAVWNVKIYHPVETTALSNTPAELEASHGVFKITRFQKTPIMSSYLLAIVVSEYEHKSAVTNSGLTVRVFAPHSEYDTIDSALIGAVKAFDYYENKTGINFPISKVDLIGFKNFANGAMENWGLITFKHNRLYGPPNSTYEIIAHEIAHQWFGNLVTAQWWNEIWLNEGSATFYECLGTDYMSNGMLGFADLIQKNIFTYLDQHLYSAYEQATTVKIDSLESIDGAFGGTTYQKGGAIMNMFRNVIGRENFDESIRNYLKGQSYSNANSSVYYSYFEMPPSYPSSVSDFLQPWYNQVGHPLITVNSYNSTHNVLTQSRFDNKMLQELDRHVQYPVWGYQWDIPVWYKNKKNQMGMVWLFQNSTAYIVKGVKINPYGNGIFRVNDKTDSKFENQESGYVQSRLSDSFALLTLDQINIKDYNKVVSGLGEMDEDSKLVVEAQGKLLRGEGSIDDFKKIVNFESMHHTDTDLMMKEAWRNFKNMNSIKKKYSIF